MARWRQVRTMALCLLLTPAMAFATGRPALAAMEDPAIAEAVARVVEQAGSQRLIVLGELHGTREIPALIGALVAHYAAQGAVTLALEVPEDEQAALQRYLDSDGGVEAWQALAGTPFWQVSDDQHDGRRSVAMRQLIEHVRALRLAGRAVAVLAHDVSRAQAEAHDHHWRDTQMAANLRAAMLQTPGTVLVLTGNVHAMRVRPDWAPAELQLAPMTSQLLDLQPFAVNITAAAGQFWGCRQERCQALPARTVMAMPVMRLYQPDRVYDLVLQLPSLSIATLVETP